MNSRKRDAERRGSRPRMRREFNIDPCRDRVSSRGGWNKMRIWVVGSVPMKEEPLQQQQQQEEAEHEFPRTFEMGYKALLAATQARLGTWPDLRVQVPALSQYETQDLWRLQESLQFKEKHPLTVTFGDDCGDFFANCSSLKPHRRKPHAECLSVTRERGRQKAQRRKGPTATSWRGLRSS